MELLERLQGRDGWYGAAANSGSLSTTKYNQDDTAGTTEEQICHDLSRTQWGKGGYVSYRTGEDGDITDEEN